MMFGSNIVEIRTETVKLSAYWAYLPLASCLLRRVLFRTLVENKGQRET